MKSTIVVCALVVLISLCFEANASTFFIAANGTECVYDGVKLNVGTNYHNCTRLMCGHDGSIEGATCPPEYCPDEAPQIGYVHDDFSKPYPECCGRPICAWDLSGDNISEK